MDVLRRGTINYVLVRMGHIQSSHKNLMYLLTVQDAHRLKLSRAESMEYLRKKMSHYAVEIRRKEPEFPRVFMDAYEA